MDSLASASGVGKAYPTGDRPIAMRTIVCHRNGSEGSTMRLAVCRASGGDREPIFDRRIDTEVDAYGWGQWLRCGLVLRLARQRMRN